MADPEQPVKVDEPTQDFSQALRRVGAKKTQAAIAFTDSLEPPQHGNLHPKPECLNSTWKGVECKL